MKAFLLSMDALVALVLLMAFALFLGGLSFTFNSPELVYQRLYYSGKDTLNIMENARVLDLQDFPTVKYYIEKGTITQDDLNKTFMDVVGSLWAAGNTSDAANLTQDVMGRFLNSSRYGYEVLIGNESIYRKNFTGQGYTARLTTIVSGYDIGKPDSGYVANAYITRLAKTTSGFAYFGGYVGDGNITQVLELPDDANISRAGMELDARGNFTMFVNGNNTGTFFPTQGNMTADNWTICDSPAGCSYFSPGTNTIQLNFTATNRSSIGGGYIRVDYDTSKPNTLPLNMTNVTATKKEMLPGIEGIINLYSSFYVPGELNAVSARLHYVSNYSIFMAIGNATVFESNATGEQEIYLGNESIAANLTASGMDFGSLGSSTIPLRIGLKNVSYVTFGTGVGDSVLVTDVSGSMVDCVVYDIPYICNYYCLFGTQKRCGVGSPGACSGNVCGGFCILPFGHWLDCEQNKLDIAKDADKEFADIVLNETVEGNRLGLVSYSNSVESYENLTDNKTVLYEEIEGYEPVGATCICCGINEAADMLVSESNTSRRRTIVVMSDGDANRECLEQATGDAKNDTIQAACDAYDNHNITVYTVGYGSTADNTTLNKTAQCGHGKYYFSNATELAETFREIAEGIVNASYSAQSVEVEGNISIGTILLADSWVELNYTPVQMLGYGEVSVELETERFGGGVESPKNSSFHIPDGVKVVDARVTSYSSDFWTDSLMINSSLTAGWKSVFELDAYGSEYIRLGDPYTIHIPTGLVGVGEDNQVSIDTALSPDNTTGGSPYNRVMFSIGVDGSVGYGDVFFSEENATEDALQRLEEKMGQYNITLIEGRTDKQSIQDVSSMWGPSRIEVLVWW